MESRPSTRPGTAARPHGMKGSDSNVIPAVTAGTPEHPIEIPQVDAESQATTTRTQVSDTSSPQKSMQGENAKSTDGGPEVERKPEASMEDDGDGIELSYHVVYNSLEQIYIRL